MNESSSHTWMHHITHTSHTYEWVIIIMSMSDMARIHNTSHTHELACVCACVRVCACVSVSVCVSVCAWDIVTHMNECITYTSHIWINHYYYHVNKWRGTHTQVAHAHAHTHTHTHTHINESYHTHIHISRSPHTRFRPTQSIMYIPFQVNRFQKSILLIVQYKYPKSCSEDFFLKNRTKIWSSAQDHAVLHLLLNTVGFYKRDLYSAKRPVFLSILRIVATPYDHLQNTYID